MSQQIFESPQGAEEEQPKEMDDGMDPIPVLERITKEDAVALFGGTPPEGLPHDIFDDGGVLELEQ